ncbi:thioredoxin family protein [Anaeromyxobacter diazotrophicus]|uniref:Thiol reductase thioredoxin n=1 Tax=Anaeromyxobacter diazotrophicus TaxID=2590199 RepID=A0A7I9VL55_9BACT|nr:thioredoxin family protein [Anaeromyxobacter diazotrophicus]GEJ57143.1 thiol reductase thioredoxin [Anaeromyxobacter diazotrophicus]
MSSCPSELPRKRWAAPKKPGAPWMALAAAALALASCARSSAGEATPPPAAQRALASTARRLPRLVDLGANQCVSCKAMTPVLEGLRSDYAGKLQVDFVDVWQDRAAAEPWHIAMIPTQIFLAADGRELGRHEGFISREEILARFESLGVALE